MAAVDAAALVHALGHTFSPDKETRVQAEAALSQVRCGSTPEERAAVCVAVSLSAPVSVWLCGCVAV
eukprot:COSAG02_NODE_5459_length_4299_cov_19.185150_2_plen_67_part_00